MEQTPNSQNQSEPTTQSAPLPKKKSKAPLIIGIIAVCIALLGAGAYFYLSLQEKAEGEETAYAILEDNYNPADYEAFLENYPESDHAREVKERLATLRTMLGTWNNIASSSRTADFVDFKNRFSDPKFTRLCDIKIDSLDWITASTTATSDAFALYLAQHPDGRYAAEASVAQGKVRDMAITPEDEEMIQSVCTGFFHGFESLNEAAICSNIVPTMTQFLSKKNATKADVLTTIKAMFNEHIQSCRFDVNRDFSISKVPDNNGSYAYRATFSVDQHIERDNEGKTFGSYSATVLLNEQFLIESLTMEEVSQH